MENRTYLTNGLNFITTADTVEDRTAKKTFLVTLNLHDLTTDKAWNAAAVRALSVGLVPLTKPATVVGKKPAWLPKDVLISSLTEYVAEEKAILAALADRTIETLSEGQYSVNELLATVETLKGDELVNMVDYQLRSKGYARSTIIKTYLPKIIKVIYDRYIGDDKTEVIKGIKARFNDDMKLENKEYKIDVSVENGSLRPLDKTGYIDLMTALLTSENPTWKELSYGLAMATGRRCSELHLLASDITVVDSCTVRFTGQLKTKTYTGKGKESEPYNIPVLVDSSTIVEAFQRLRDTGKTFDDAANAHSLLSKALSTELPMKLKARLSEIGITKYKDTRAAYALICTQQFKPATQSDNYYVASIMGHSADDIATASSYNDFCLVA